MSTRHNEANPHDHQAPDSPEFEEPINVEPDDPDDIEAHRFFHAHPRPPVDAQPSDRAPAPIAAVKTKNNGKHQPPPDPNDETRREPMSEALRWALDSMHQPAMAAADWLAGDIDPKQPSAAAMLTNPSITLAQVRQAKTVFKTMRIVGEKSADRRVGARMYAAAIAAGIVRFDKKVSTQSDEALMRGFQGLLDDRRMPAALRDLAGMALCKMQRKDQNGMALPETAAIPQSKTA